MNHVIRLRGPWEFRVASRASGSPPPLTEHGRQTLPDDWSKPLGTGFRGSVNYRRVFHRPSGLENGQQVWLVFAGVASIAEVSLNQQPLGRVESDGGRFQIESLLDRSNVLEVAIEHDSVSDPGGLTGLVSLEIQTVRPRPVH